MIATDEETVRALARLSTNPDFKTFLHWLEDEKTAVLGLLLGTKDTVTVHQLQGSAQVLVDIERAVMSAPEAAKGFAPTRRP